FGIDVNEQACRIACFSLYLALLDQLEPRDILDLQKGNERFLPTLLLRKNETQPQDVSRTILCRNFFEKSIPLPHARFDLIVGNPPWVARGKATDPIFLKWRSENPDKPVPQKQMAHGFMWKVPEYLSAFGRACLLLPSSVLLNRTDTFQSAWFRRITVEHIVQLSDMRFFLFPQAHRPAIVARFGKAAPSPESTRVEYDVPKTDMSMLYGRTVATATEDRKELRLSDILDYAARDEAAVLWKANLWSTPRDMSFLEKLMSLPSLKELVGSPGEGKRWTTGQGFQYSSKRPKKSWWRSDYLFIQTGSVPDLILMDTDCAEVGDRFANVHRPRNCAIFVAPMVVASQGFTHVAYSDFDLLFKSSLQSIAGQGMDADLLMFLAVVLSSPLSNYFLFHTAANWGTERDKVHLFELLRMPFPLPEQTGSPKEAGKTVQHVAGEMKALKKQILDRPCDREELTQKANRDFLSSVYSYYDIDDWERILIEDTANIIEPSSTPPAPSPEKTPTLCETTRVQWREYLALVCEVINTWAHGSKERVSGRVTVSKGAGLAVVTLLKSAESESAQIHESPEKLSHALKRISDILPVKVTPNLTQLRNLKVFDGNELHILKPLALRFWTRTAALNDADEIAFAILSHGQ
ncbi:MAG TPA: hypothetical protein VM223_11920, partial [Planctomycetota bacterium]|nr:hypothetical protein [Planctomycetota bacterium]